MKSHRAALAALLLLALGVYGAFLDRTALGSPDEPRYALVAREMMETGNWWVPHLHGEVYSQKPPVFFWSIALAARIWGAVDEVSARIPSVLAAVGLLALTWGVARQLFPDPVAGARIGLLAAAMLATCSRFLVLASRANIDCMMSFWTFAAFWCALRGFAWRGPTDAVRRAPALLAFGFAALAVLTKGAGGLLFLSIWLLWFLLRRDGAGLRRVPWLSGFAVMLAVLLAWLVPAAVSGGGEYLNAILYKQTVTRMVDPWTHRQPFWFYLQTLPVNLLPWTLLLPVAGVAIGFAWRHRAPEDAADRPGLGLALLGFAFTFVFFTVLPTKRDYYLLPSLPWLALLVAWGFDRALQQATRASGWRAVTHGSVVTLAAAALAGGVWLVAWSFGGREALPPLLGGQVAPEVAVTLGGTVAGLGTCMVLTAILGAALSWRRRGHAALAALALGGLLVWAIYRAEIRPAFNANRSGRDLALRIAAHAGPEDRVLMVTAFDESLLFYSRRRMEWLDLPKPERVVELLAEPGRDWLVTTRTFAASWDGLVRAGVIVEVDAGMLGRDACVVFREAR